MISRSASEACCISASHLMLIASACGPRDFVPVQYRIERLDQQLPAL
jgi:hypothetical protein